MGRRTEFAAVVHLDASTTSHTSCKSVTRSHTQMASSDKRTTTCGCKPGHDCIPNGLTIIREIPLRSHEVNAMNLSTQQHIVMAPRSNVAAIRWRTSQLSTENQRRRELHSAATCGRSARQPAFRSDGGRYGTRSSSKMWHSSVAGRSADQPSGQLCSPVRSMGAPSSGTNHALPCFTAVILTTRQQHCRHDAVTE